MQVNDLEMGVVEKLLEDPIHRPNRQSVQWSAIHVKSRSMSGVGFLTEFEPSTELKLFHDETSLRWGEVGARLNAVGIETGYVVYVDRGQITAVEGYTYSGQEWPSHINAIDWYELKDGTELKNPAR